MATVASRTACCPALPSGQAPVQRRVAPQRRKSAFCCCASGQAGSSPQWPEQMRARHNCDSSQPSVMQRRTSSPVGSAGSSCCRTTSRVEAPAAPTAATWRLASPRRPAAACLPPMCDTSASIRSTSGSFCGEAFACFVSPRLVGVAVRFAGRDARLGLTGADDAFATAARVDGSAADTAASSPARGASGASEENGSSFAAAGATATVSMTAACGSVSFTSGRAAATGWDGSVVTVTRIGSGSAGASAQSAALWSSMYTKPATVTATAATAIAATPQRRVLRGFVAGARRLRGLRVGASMLDRMLTGPQSGSRASSAVSRSPASNVGRRFALVVSWFKPLSPSKSARHGFPPAGPRDSIDPCCGCAGPKSFVTS